jgi:hypothetical protein
MMDGDECGAFGGIIVGGETEALGEIIPQCRFVHHISYTI